MSLKYLEECLKHWNNIIRLTQDRYKPMPYVSMGHPGQRWPEFTSFHWQSFLQDVEADIDYVQNLD